MVKNLLCNKNMKIRLIRHNFFSEYLYLTLSEKFNILTSCITSLEGKEMRYVSIISFVFLLTMFIISCHENDPQQNFLQFNDEFFKNYVPEFPTSRLLLKTDIPPRQQQFFDEAGGQLQLLADLNGNDIPEYFVCGICEQCLLGKLKKPYFIAIFERQKDGIKRLFFQQIYVPPVHFNLSTLDSRVRVVISFAFYSDYGAEIYYENGAYHLADW